MIDALSEQVGRAGEAQSALEEGLALFQQGDVPGAHDCFQRAHRKAVSDARAMSWYGVTLVLVEKNSNLGMMLCDQAVRTAGPEPELCLNQARVHLALGQRDRCVRAIQRGLEQAPRDPALMSAQATLGWRKKPVLRFLSRNNWLNRWLGRVRHKWSKRVHPTQDPTPMNLGEPGA
jgi:tetratricopeptide (TPR) repeat protein